MQIKKHSGIRDSDYTDDQRRKHKLVRKFYEQGISPYERGRISNGEASIYNQPSIATSSSPSTSPLWFSEKQIELSALVIFLINA